jgi:hypothetical protein
MAMVIEALPVPALKARNDGAETGVSLAGLSTRGRRGKRIKRDRKGGRSRLKTSAGVRASPLCIVGFCARLSHVEARIAGAAQVALDKSIKH